MTDSPHNMLPVPDADTSFFWEAGKDGVLRILGCNSCDNLIQPPVPICPKCLSRDVTPRDMSGHGTVWSFTVNVHPWFPDMKLPYILASVELEEQEGLRLTTHITDIAPEDVRIDMPVEVYFREDEDVWLPSFRPRPA
jgi:uncharacterized protein